MHLTAVLVSEQCGGLGQSHGQVTVGTLTVQKYLILERAGHGTECEAFLFLIVGVAQNEHTVKVVIPVAGNFVKLSLSHVRSLGELAALGSLNVLYPSLHQLDNLCALGEEYRQTLTDIINSCEIFKLTADLVVVTVLSLFYLLEISLKLGSLGECSTVNSAKLLALGVASPVSACAVGELECLYGCNGHKVGACAQVNELALLVEAYLFTLVAVLLAKLHLVRLAHFGKLCNSLVGSKLKA